jgi:hypothetical protein
LCGSAPAVGVAGYLLGGGLNPLARTYGFSADHIQAVEVVTPADGSLTVTAESHPDLFWALRGGKGGLGVVTAGTIGLLPLTEVYGGAPRIASQSLCGQRAGGPFLHGLFLRSAFVTSEGKKHEDHRYRSHPVRDVCRPILER